MVKIMFIRTVQPKIQSYKNIGVKFYLTLVHTGVNQSSQSRDTRLFDWSIPAESKILLLNSYIGSGSDLYLQKV